MFDSYINSTLTSFTGTVTTEMNVAIIGASSFIGKNMMLQLPRHWKVWAFYNTSANFVKEMKCENIGLGNAEVQYVQQNLSMGFNVGNKIPKCFDLVISFIGNTSHVPDNLQPQYNLYADGMAIAGFFKQFCCNKLIYVSSTGVYENHRGLVSSRDTKDLIPSSSYAITKLLSERLIEYYRIKGKINNYLIVRLSGAYGPYQKPNRLISRLIKRFYFERGDSISLIGDGKNSTDLCFYVSDVINFVYLAIQQDFKNDVVDLCTGKYMPLNKLVNRVIGCFNKEQLVKWNGVNTGENHYFKVKNTKPFGFKPQISLEQGVNDLATWLQQHKEYLPLKADVV